jgi:hypothetical protein
LAGILLVSGERGQTGKNLCVTQLSGKMVASVVVQGALQRKTGPPRHSSAALVGGVTANFNPLCPRRQTRNA